VKLVEATLAQVRVKTGPRRRGKPNRLIGDRGYDSNTVRAFLVKRGIEPIIPARSNNTVATHQDGRKLRRYQRRWIIERSHSWLQTFRRLVVRYERSEKIFAALVHMACGRSSGNVCVNSRPLRDGMKTPAVLHGLGDMH
jgi:transposase